MCVRPNMRDNWDRRLPRPDGSGFLDFRGRNRKKQIHLFRVDNPRPSDRRLQFDLEDLFGHCRPRTELAPIRGWFRHTRDAESFARDRDWFETSIGLFNLSGAVGILVASLVGAFTFDSWRPAAPFILFGILAGIVLIWAFIVKNKVVPVEENK